MSNLNSLYHYEFIEGRTNGRQWRVGDQDDDLVTDFTTRDSASRFVCAHNLLVDENYRRLGWFFL